MTSNRIRPRFVRALAKSYGLEHDPRAQRLIKKWAAYLGPKNRFDKDNRAYLDHWFETEETINDAYSYIKGATS